MGDRYLKSVDERGPVYEDYPDAPTPVKESTSSNSDFRPAREKPERPLNAFDAGFCFVLGLIILCAFAYYLSMNTSLRDAFKADTIERPLHTEEELVWARTNLLSQQYHSADTVERAAEMLRNDEGVASLMSVRSRPRSDIVNALATVGHSTPEVRSYIVQSLQRLMDDNRPSSVDFEVAAACRAVAKLDFKEPPQILLRFIEQAEHYDSDWDDVHVAVRGIYARPDAEKRSETAVLLQTRFARYHSQLDTAESVEAAVARPGLKFNDWLSLTRQPERKHVAELAETLAVVTGDSEFGDIARRLHEEWERKAKRIADAEQARRSAQTTSVP